MPTLDSCEYRANQQYSNPDDVLEYVDLSECDWTLGDEMPQWYCLFMYGVGSGFWPMYENQPEFDYIPNNQEAYYENLPNCVIGADEIDIETGVETGNTFACTCNGITDSNQNWEEDWNEGYQWIGDNVYQHISCNICIREPEGTTTHNDVYGKCFNGNPPSWSAAEIRILQDDTGNPQYGYCCDETAANYSGELACSSAKLPDIIGGGTFNSLQSFIPFAYQDDSLTIPGYYDFEHSDGSIEKLQRYHIDEGRDSNNTCPAYGETDITQQSYRDPLGIKGCSCFCKYMDSVGNICYPYEMATSEDGILVCEINNNYESNQKMNRLGESRHYLEEELDSEEVYRMGRHYLPNFATVGYNYGSELPVTECTINLTEEDLNQCDSPDKILGKWWCPDNPNDECGGNGDPGFWNGSEYNCKGWSEWTDLEKQTLFCYRGCPDNSMVINEAIKNAEDGDVICLPPGDYAIMKDININRSNVTLSGASDNGTRLYFGEIVGKSGTGENQDITKFSKVVSCLFNSIAETQLGAAINPILPSLLDITDSASCERYYDGLLNPESFLNKEIEPELSGLCLERAAEGPSNAWRNSCAKWWAQGNHNGGDNNIMCSDYNSMMTCNQIGSEFGCSWNGAECECTGELCEPVIRGYGLYDCYGESIDGDCEMLDNFDNPDILDEVNWFTDCETVGMNCNISICSSLIGQAYSNGCFITQPQEHWDAQRDWHDTRPSVYNMLSDWTKKAGQPPGDNTSDSWIGDGEGLYPFEWHFPDGDTNGEPCDYFDSGKPEGWGWPCNIQPDSTASGRGHYPKDDDALTFEQMVKSFYVPGYCEPPEDLDLESAEDGVGYSGGTCKPYCENPLIGCDSDDETYTAQEKQDNREFYEEYALDKFDVPLNGSPCKYYTSGRGDFECSYEKKPKDFCRATCGRAAANLRVRSTDVSYSSKIPLAKSGINKSNYITIQGEITQDVEETSPLVEKRPGVIARRRNTSIQKGDEIKIYIEMSEQVRTDHNIPSDYWTSFTPDGSSIPMFTRTVTKTPERLDERNFKLTLDIPLRYKLPLHYNPFVKIFRGQIENIGIENIQMSNALNYDDAQNWTGQSLIRIDHSVKNSWIRNVNSFSDQDFAQLVNGKFFYDSPLIEASPTWNWNGIPQPGFNINGDTYYEDDAPDNPGLPVVKEPNPPDGVATDIMTKFLCAAGGAENYIETLELPDGECNGECTNMFDETFPCDNWCSCGSYEGIISDTCVFTPFTYQELLDSFPTQEEFVEWILSSGGCQGDVVRGYVNVGMDWESENSFSCQGPLPSCESSVGLTGTAYSLEDCCALKLGGSIEDYIGRLCGTTNGAYVGVECLDSSEMNYSTAKEGMDEIMQTALNIPNPKNIINEPRHLISHGISIDGGKNITIKNCTMKSPQNRLAGGRGYLFSIASGNEILVEDCYGYRGRHNFLLGGNLRNSGIVLNRIKSEGGWSFGNTGEGSSDDDYWSRYQELEAVGIGVPGFSDTHLALNQSFLITDSDLWDGFSTKNRQSLSEGAGITGTEGVFWNVRSAPPGEPNPRGDTSDSIFDRWQTAAVPGMGVLESHQFGSGYIKDSQMRHLFVDNDDPYAYLKQTISDASLLLQDNWINSSQLDENDIKTFTFLGGPVINYLFTKLFPPIIEKLAPSVIPGLPDIGQGGCNCPDGAWDDDTDDTNPEGCLCTEKLVQGQQCSWNTIMRKFRCNSDNCSDLINIDNVDIKFIPGNGFDTSDAYEVILKMSDFFLVADEFYLCASQNVICQAANVGWPGCDFHRAEMKMSQMHLGFHLPIDGNPIMIQGKCDYRWDKDSPTKEQCAGVWTPGLDGFNFDVDDWFAEDDLPEWLQDLANIEEQINLGFAEAVMQNLQDAWLPMIEPISNYFASENFDEVTEQLSGPISMFDAGEGTGPNDYIYENSVSLDPVETTPEVEPYPIGYGHVGQGYMKCVQWGDDANNGNWYDDMEWWEATEIAGDTQCNSWQDLNEYCDGTISGNEAVGSCQPDGEYFTNGPRDNCCDSTSAGAIYNTQRFSCGMFTEIYPGLGGTPDYFGPPGTYGHTCDAMEHYGCSYVGYYCEGEPTGDEYCREGDASTNGNVCGDTLSGMCRPNVVDEQTGPCVCIDESRGCVKSLNTILEIVAPFWQTNWDGSVNFDINDVTHYAGCTNDDLSDCDNGSIVVGVFKVMAGDAPDDGLFPDVWGTGYGDTNLYEYQKEYSSPFSSNEYNKSADDDIKEEEGEGYYKKDGVYQSPSEEHLNWQWYTELETTGCTDPNAWPNYDENADFDNNSCTYYEDFYGTGDMDGSGLLTQNDVDIMSSYLDCFQEPDIPTIIGDNGEMERNEGRPEDCVPRTLYERGAYIPLEEFIKIGDMTGDGDITLLDLELLIDTMNNQEIDLQVALDGLLKLINFTLDRVMVDDGNGNLYSTCWIMHLLTIDIDTITDDFPEYRYGNSNGLMPTGGYENACQEQGSGVVATCTSIQEFFEFNTTGLGDFNFPIHCSFRIDDLIGYGTSRVCAEEQVLEDYWSNQCQNGNYDCYYSGDVFTDDCDGLAQLDGNFKVGFEERLETFLAIAKQYGFCEEDENVEICELIESRYCYDSLQDWCSVASGCTDIEACNYDELAYVDDGSCLYEDSYPNGCLSNEDCQCWEDVNLDGIYDMPVTLYFCPDETCSDQNIIQPGNTHFYSDEVGQIIGCTDPLYCEYNADATITDRDMCLTFPNQYICYEDTDGDGDFERPVVLNWCEGEYDSCEDYPGDYVSEENQGFVYGCNDISACNYDIGATENDGSCDYGTGGYFDDSYPEVFRDYYCQDINVLKHFILLNPQYEDDGETYDFSIELLIQQEHTTFDEGNLVELDFQRMSLKGRLPDEIGFADRLQVLNVSLNGAGWGGEFGGPIPESIGNLKDLTKFNGAGNRWTGNIPNSMFPTRNSHNPQVLENGLQNLTFLDLQGDISGWPAGSGLTGPIPDNFGLLPNLTYLALQRHNLTGELPESVGELTNVTYFEVGTNSLVGIIPESICDMIENSCALGPDCEVESDTCPDDCTPNHPFLNKNGFCAHLRPRCITDGMFGDVQDSKACEDFLFSQSIPISLHSEDEMLSSQLSKIIKDKNIDDERKIKMVSKKVKSNIRKRTDFNE